MTPLSRKRLNLYKFLTVKLTDDDLYPHFNYGEEFTLTEVQKFWKETVTMIIKKRAPELLGLYIHIPFCKQKCTFCFCDSYVPSSYRTVQDYIAILKKEINTFKDIFDPVSFNTVYFGGGSPSYLKTEDLTALFEYIKESFHIKADAQIIFEGTPEDLTGEVLSVIAEQGVNLLTIGAQSLDAKVIKLIKRPQSKKKFIEVFRSARQLGITSIMVDLVAGLEGQSFRSFMKDLELVLELGADNVQVTGFTPLAHTPFCMAGKVLSSHQKKEREKMIAGAHKVLDRFYRQKGFRASGKIVNLQETQLQNENASIFGIGYGAQSHAFGQGWYHHPHLVPMKKKPDYTKIPPFMGVRGSIDEEMRRFIIHNLKGDISRNLFYRLFKKDIIKTFQKEIGEMIRLNLFRIEEDRIISLIKRRKDHLVLSKIFYSQDRLKKIFNAHKHEYSDQKNYQKELDTLYADTD